MDTLIEVKETDGQATLNVSISSPQPILGFRPLQTMFSLRVDSMDGSAGRDGTPNVVIFHKYVSISYLQPIPYLQFEIMFSLNACGFYARLCRYVCNEP